MSAAPKHPSRGTRWSHLLAAFALGAAVAGCTGGNERAETTAATDVTEQSESAQPVAPATDAATTTSSATVVSFSSTGTERGGLSWLDEPSAVARWQLTDLPVEATDLDISVRAVAPSGTIDADGNGVVLLAYGQGDSTFGSHEITLPAAPLGENDELALLSGSTLIAESELPDQLDGLWVEIAPTTDSTGLAVAPDSLTVDVAATAPDGAQLAAPPEHASAPEVVRLDGEFTTNGDLIEGWYWLRDQQLYQFAHWTFPVVPNLADGVTAQLHLLATDTYDGGPGVDARFYLSYGFLGADGDPLGSMGGSSGTGDGTETTAPPTTPPPETTAPQRKFAPPPRDSDYPAETLLLTVPNISPPDDPVGYTAQDTLTIPADEIPADAVGMWFEATRSDPAGVDDPTTEHVAFNAASIGLLLGLGDSGEADGDATDTGDDTGDEDGTDGGATTGSIESTCEFASDGDPISGWYWLRDAAFTQYARWTCFEVPNLADGVEVRIDMLATDGADGGPGVDGRFYFTTGYFDAAGAPLAPQVGVTTLLTVPNVAPPDDPVGYTAQDTVAIPADEIPDGAVGMWFEASRSDPGRLGDPTTEHVAFNAGSIVLLTSAGTGDDGSGSDTTTDEGSTTTTTDDTGTDDTSDDDTGDDDTGDDGDVDTGGDVLDDPDGLADADSEADADEVGDLPPGTYHGTLDGETEDWFAFQLAETQLVEFSITADATLYLATEVHDPIGDFRAPREGEPDTKHFTHAAGRGDGGRWYVRFVRLQGSGDYTFTFTVRDANDGLLHLDAGDTIDTATAVGPGDLLGELYWDDGGDWYEVDIPAGRGLTATVATTIDESLEVEIRDANRHLVTDDISYLDEPAALYLEPEGADRTVTLSIERYDSLGGPYRLRLDVSGLGECSGTTVDAVDFHSGGDPTGILGGHQDGWSWMRPEVDTARGQATTWTFDSLPDDPVVRLMIDVQLNRTIDPGADDAWAEAWPPTAAAAWFTYGIVTDDGSVSVSAPQFVTLSIVPRSGSPTGFSAIGELDIAHADLSGADVAWWVRMSMIDPTALRPARGTGTIGVSTSSLTVCAGGTIDELDGLTGPVDPPEIAVTFDAASKTMTSDVSMFVEPITDLDGDGLNQSFENQAIDLANPVIALDEEDLWQHWLDDVPTATFAQATLWPSISNPQYVVLGFLSTWAYDAGGGAQGIDVTQQAHRGDSERIWEAWKILDDHTITLEWVNTSAHASYTEHSGIWHVTDRQCIRAYVAKVSGVTGDWGFFEVMCDDLEFSDDGRVVMHTAENKHAMYPSGWTCETVSVGANAQTGIRLWGEDCDWIEEPPITDTLNHALWALGWHDWDFDDDPRYLTFGRWLFDVYNVGEPGYPLIDDLDEPSSWLGLTDAQIASLTGLYPTEAVWTGHDDYSRFCGGLEMGDVIEMPWWGVDKVMPNDPENCSTKLGSKFTSWQTIFLDAMAYRYRVTLETGTPTGAGTDDAVYVELHDADGTLLAMKRYDGDLENGATDIVYLPPYGSGGDVATVSIRRSGLDNTTFANWYLDSVAVEDLETGLTSSYTAGQWILPGAGITL